MSSPPLSSTPERANFCAPDGTYRLVPEGPEPTDLTWSPSHPPGGPPAVQPGDGIDPAPGPVLLCHRPVDIQLPDYLITLADLFGVDRNHWWLKTDRVQFGMGPAPGARDEWGAPSVQVDQTDSHRDPRAVCLPVEPAIDPTCVEGFFAPGADTGAWKWPWHTCRSYVDEILAHCRTTPNPRFDGAGHSL